MRETVWYCPEHDCIIITCENLLEGNYWCIVGVYHRMIKLGNL